MWGPAERVWVSWCLTDVGVLGGEWGWGGLRGLN